MFQFRKIDKFCMIRYIPRIESYLYLNQNVYQFHITYMYITFHAQLSKNWGGAVIGILFPCISIIIFIYCVKVSSYRYIMIMLIFVKMSPASCLYNYFPFEFILFICVKLEQRIRISSFNILWYNFTLFKQLK